MSELLTLEPPVNTTPRETEPLRSVHTSNFPAILNQLNSSLVVSTYQAGRLVMVRPDGDSLNTHFRGFHKPMGVAIEGNKMAIGTATEIVEFRDIPAVADRLEDGFQARSASSADEPSTAARSHSDRKPDACFLPKLSHVTGDIQIHEMEFGKSPASRVKGREPDAIDSQHCTLNSQLDTLWFVNTRFSCLCTRSNDHSFMPRWRPPFVSALAPQDRCHLNGMAMVDGRPKYATALGESDQPGGWRENKASGGVLVDVDSGEVITRGLSMPHSPRWYAGKLWVLNSGDGGVGVVDPRTGCYEQIAELPGFTRGLSFLGNLAFVGLSQVRESAIFSGIRIAQRPEDERWCGVVIVEINSGKPIAWLRFEGQVQEIFAVNVLPGRTWPDVLTDNAELVGTSYVVPDDALLAVPNEWRS